MLWAKHLITKPLIYRGAPACRGPKFRARSNSRGSIAHRLGTPEKFQILPKKFSAGCIAFVVLIATVWYISNMAISIETAARYRKLRKARRKLGDPKVLVTDRRKMAKRRGLEFSITADTLPRVPAVCPVFGVPFGGRVGAPNLDRIDNAKGYVPGNVQWVSSLANRIKSDATAAEVAAVAAFLLKHELMS